MSGSQILQYIANGLANGCIYVLVAMGFNIIFSSTGVINFAQGEFAMLGAFVMVTVVVTWGVPFIPAFLLVLVAAAIIGVIFERIAYRPLKEADGATFLAATLAAAVLIRNIGLKIWGPYPVPFHQPFGMTMITWGGIRIRPQDLLIVGFIVVLAAALYYFFFRTRTGKIMRAMSQDRSTAQLLGVRVLAMGTLAFILASMLGATAGILVAPIYFVSLEMGFIMGLKAFVATIIGGWGSLPGAIVGGLVVGLVETFGAVYISSVYKDAFAFGLLIVFLIIRPQGIFGEKIADKA